MKVDRIKTNPNINFKANFFLVKKYGQNSGIYISTDNSENLGSHPILEVENRKISMVYDGKYYTTEHNIGDNDKYKIKYEDTGKYENNGKEKYFIPQKLYALINQMKKTPNTVLSKGSAQGKLVQAKNIDDILLKSKEPLIIICDNNEEWEKCYKYFNRTNGIILKSGSTDLLSHFAALCRDYFSFGELITDKKILNDLNNLEGKLISISNKNNNLEYFKIDNIVKRSRGKDTIEIPPMRRVDKILSLEECEKDTVGNKAYNLKRMKNLVNEGKLQDVIIPNAFVLPYGYLEKVENIITENPNNKWHDNEILDEIKDYASKVITQRNVMVRSAFNGEDLEGYSAAGLYDSHSQNTKDLLLYDIYQVMNSKNKLLAVKSREKHNIPDDLIKPSVIIQDRIISDYSFTTYTEAPFDKNKILIELFINKERWCKPDPYQITYNKLTKKLKIEQEHSKFEEYLFNENYKLIHKQSTSLKNINEIRDIIENLVKNALVLEKEFGKPQDIEGGIKNGQLYFWQTRNIVKKIH